VQPAGVSVWLSDAIGFALTVVISPKIAVDFMFRHFVTEGIFTSCFPTP